MKNRTKESVFRKAKSRIITNRMRSLYFMRLGVQESIKENTGNYCNSAGLSQDEHYD